MLIRYSILLIIRILRLEKLQLLSMRSDIKRDAYKA